MLLTVRGDFGGAQQSLYSSLRIASEIGHREYVVGARHTLGMLYAELFAFDQALEQLEEALTLAEELHSPIWIHDAIGTLAEVYLMLGDWKSAQACLEDVITSNTHGCIEHTLLLGTAGGAGACAG